ncbi:hypothetical protein RRG08_031943 [Elysia crispata]|uniref:Uncharacterized protein n=1 Tax=Elysia crispata TaxID=231223 RepID=A0AAE1AGV8_9GAST|nr:hypothetical protein RRG08_031943 [Elysia crispata]
MASPTTPASRSGENPAGQEDDHNDNGDTDGGELKPLVKPNGRRESTEQEDTGQAKDPLDQSKSGTTGAEVSPDADISVMSEGTSELRPLVSPSGDNSAVKVDSRDELREVPDTAVVGGPKKRAEDNVGDSRSPPTRRSGLRKYSQGLKKALPVRIAKTPKNQIPLETNGLVNFSTFGWLNRLLWGVFKNGADHVKSYTITEKESAEVNAERMERFWQEERAMKGDAAASFGKAIFKSFKTRLLIGALLSLFLAFLTLSIPIILIQYFLSYLTEEEVTVKGGILYVILLGLVIGFRSIAASFTWMLYFEAATRIKYGTLALFYQKILRVKSLQGKSEGDMANFITNDGQRIWDSVIMGPFILSGPMVVIISSVYCVIYLGPWALISVFTILGFFPFLITFAKMSEKFKGASIILTDKRVAMVTQMLSSIKLIKMCVWEKAFTRKVSEMREAEAAILSKSVFVTSMNMGVAMLVPVLAACLCFVAYVANGNNLTPTQAFTFVALLNTMQSAMMAIPFALKSFAELAVTTRRIQEILLMNEIEEYPPMEEGSADVVRLTNASFSWGKSASKEDEAEKDEKAKNAKNKKSSEREEEEERLQEAEAEETRVTAPVLHDISLSVKKGTLVGVCGTVGSGKSSLINVILGRLEPVSGKIALTSDHVAYVPQQAWITNSSLRDNITFGNSFEPDRYKSVVEACALAEDFRTFSAGDITEAGERGANLSGGQRQRLSLARATYSQASLVLLDDPLSAVDAHVAGHIFQHCILGQLRASGSTVVLVSHQLKFLKECDEIVVMKDGAIAEQGSPDQLLASGKEYANLITLFTEEHDANTEISTASLVENNTKPDATVESSNSVADNKKNYVGTKEPEKLMEEEKMDPGSMEWGVVGQYVSHMGGCCVAAVLMVSFILPVVGATLASWFLSHWLQQGGGSAVTIMSNTTANWTVPSKRVVDNPDRGQYLLIYFLIVLGTAFLTIIKSLAVTKWTLTASTTMHNQGIQRIVFSPMSFFYSTPIGRMVNRFSADLDEIDSRLPMNLDVFLSNVLQIFGALAIIIYVSPWFALATIPLSMIFFFLWIVFHRSVRQLKMLDNVTRSPIISHLGASIQGLASINTFRRTEDFVKQHCELLNSNSVAVLLFYSANRWLALRLDLVSTGIAVVTGFLVLITYDHLNPALAGLALTFSIQMSSLFQFATRLAVETEARLSSAQRILEYCHLTEKEGSVVPAGNTQTPGDKWPFRGEIVFNNVKLRYRPEAPLALNDINVDIRPGEKIGIVGRTGAGKSSLSVAMFRLVELESGSIVVDGLDISKLDLEHLRRGVSVIPQDPVLFTASVRYNLDPFKEFSDNDLWQALEKCHVKDLVQGLEGHLEFQVSEAGENFSVGEKQLMCMARALLRDSKVVVLDEATAAVDLETDRQMQETLKDAFEGCTLLIIAHRLTSVVTCDRVMVMDNGQVHEFDTPENLMSRSNSMFKSMLEAAS